MRESFQFFKEEQNDKMRLFIVGNNSHQNSKSDPRLFLKYITTTYIVHFSHQINPHFLHKFITTGKNIEILKHYLAPCMLKLASWMI